MRDYLGAVPPEELATTRANRGGGHWQPSVLDCLRVIFEEEWHHYRYVVRDLDVIDTRRG